MELGTPVQVVQQLTTSREFVRWMIRKRKKLTEHELIHHYLAMLACEMRRTWVKNKRAPKVEDFLLKVQLARDPNKPLTEEEIKAKIEQSKAAWAMLMNRPKGLKKKKKSEAVQSKIPKPIKRRAMKTRPLTTKKRKS